MGNTTKTTLIAFAGVLFIGAVIYLLRADQFTSPIDVPDEEEAVLVDEEVDESTPVPPMTTPSEPMEEVTGEEESVSEEPVDEHPLAGTAWNWTLTTGVGDSVLAQAPSPSPFVLRFNDETSMSSATDCNQMGSDYSVSHSTISFGPMYSTKMYCEGSMESVYAAQLSEVIKYAVEGDALRLTLANDAGMMHFVRVIE